MQESLEDFRKRYKGAWVFLTIQNTDHLVRYDSDNEEDFCFYSPSHGDILVDEATARENITIKFPKIGLYNIGNNQVVEFTRYPMRQWKRAPCPDNTLLAWMERKIVGWNPRQQVNLHSSNVREFFFPRYPDNLPQALAMGRDYIALDRLFGIGIAPKKEEERKILFYLSQPIGWIDWEKKKLDIRFHPLFQETYDYFSKKEPEWAIEKN